MKAKGRSTAARTFDFCLFRTHLRPAISGPCLLLEAFGAPAEIDIRLLPISSVTRYSKLIAAERVGFIFGPKSVIVNFSNRTTTVLTNTLIQMNERDSRSNGFSAVNTEEICAVTPALALASSPKPF